MAKVSNCIGNGIPSSVTPDRIRATLDLANSHERLIKEALDASATVAWMDTGPDDDIYARFAALFATPQGRDAYEAARSRFEQSKARLAGRADFLERLVDSCRVQAFGNAFRMSGEESDNAILIERLVEQEAWAHVAEVVWATAIGSGDAGLLLDTANKHPQTEDYLQQVLDGLGPERERGGSSGIGDRAAAADLVQRLRTSAEALDASRLDESLLRSIADCAEHLIEVARADGVRARAIESQRAVVRDWQARHQGSAAETPPVADWLVKLDAQIERGLTPSDHVDRVLGLLEQFLTVGARHRDARENVAKALRDSSPLTPAAETLDSIGVQQEELRASIQSCFSSLGPATSLDGERDDLEEPGSGGRGAREPQTEYSETGAQSQVDSAEARGSEKGPGASDAAPGALGVKPEAPPLDGAKHRSSGTGVERKEDDIATDIAVATPPREDGDDREDAAAALARDTEPTDGNDIEHTAGEPCAHRDDDTGRVEDPASTQEGNDVAGTDVERTLDDDIALAINLHRLGLAYHLASSSPDVLLSADLVTLVACNYVTDRLAPVGAEIPRIADSLLVETKRRSEGGTAHAGSSDFVVLAACAALNPALVAPGGPSGQLLGELAQSLTDMPSLRMLAKTASDVSMTGIELPPSLLRDEADDSKWAEAEAGLRSETESWLAGERKATLRFHAATMVWRRLLDDWGAETGRPSLGRLFGLVQPAADVIDTAELAEVAQFWRASPDKELDRVDRELRGSAALKRIEGSARNALRAKIDQAITFADRWLSLLAERPALQSQFHTTQARLVREAVAEHLSLAVEEVRGTVVGTAASALLARYGSLFGDGLEPVLRAANLSELLHGDLLANPEVAFNETGRPVDIPVSPEAVSRLVECDPDFAGAAVERARRGDFGGAAMAIRFAESTGRVDEVEAYRARNGVDELRDRLRMRLTDRLHETMARLDAAHADGSLTWEVYDQQNAVISRLDPDDDSYSYQFDTLDEAERAIESAKSIRRDSIRETVARLVIAKDVKDRIDSVVDDGRLQIAEDFLERLEQGVDLPPVELERDPPFGRFYPEFVERFAALEQRDEDAIDHVRQAIRSRSSSDLIDARNLSDRASQEGMALLDAWTTLRGSPTSVRVLQPLMAALGFEQPTVKGSPSPNARRPSGEPVLDLSVAPIADRDKAALPEFGSRANGAYRLLTVRDRGTAEAVVHEVEGTEARRGPPNIVVFVGVLDVDSRRTLARDLASGKYHPTLVLDEALVAFLSAWPGRRLSAFFDCTSAFAFSQPYDPDAPALPAEMFFGREKARDAILATSGDLTHFVYGGRRLGKTALLADIARRYGDRPAGGSGPLVLLVNLKGTGIGENRPTEDIWGLFAGRLAEAQVLQPGTVRPGTVSRGVQEWLNESEGRRILLLVDEADAFLEAERRPEQGYRVLDGIKVLMEETERRFKVVFAGLHNVQRAAKDPNTPFAHLGEPVRIGPMLPGTDGDEIQRLVREPLEALGYRFASSDSIVRIAAETNYYPALVQQFCKELLKTMRETADASVDDGPPYTIHPDMIDRVFDAKETRDRVRKLFSWTIELDPRYEFLTYLIAQRSFDFEGGRPKAISIADIREAALREWPDGFAHDSSYWMFEVLLDEMVGLGILRESTERYAIRTRNLRMLLGNDEAIERRLSDASRRRAPPIFDPPEFRDSLDDGAPSSLTAGQETRLLSHRHKVGLVFGTALAGLDRVCESIRKAAERPDASVLFSGDLTQPGDLSNALRQAARSRRPGTEIVLVDMRDTWDDTAFSLAVTSVEGQEGQTRSVRPVFLCGPSVARRRLLAAPATLDGASAAEVWLSPCARDFTRIWLTGRESRARDSFESQDSTVDLPWPATVAAAAANTELKSMEEVVEFCLDDDQIGLSDILVSDEARIAFGVLCALTGDPVTADELAEFVQEEGADMSPEDALAFLSWGDRLGVLCRTAESYRLDSTYAMALARVLGR